MQGWRLFVKTVEVNCGSHLEDVYEKRMSHSESRACSRD
jgi:hypothetical protein